MDNGSLDEVWEFGCFRADPALLTLYRDDMAVDIPPRQFALLMALMCRAGQCVDKDTLLQEVWGTLYLTEGVIKTAISGLRTRLDDDPRQPRWVETVPRKGYRFVGSVQRRLIPAAHVVPLVTDGDRPRDLGGNLPQALLPLIGRDTELVMLTKAVQASSLITVIGPGGVGKTSLARAVAQSIRAQGELSPWWVELASLDAAQTDEAVLCATAADALRLPATALSSTTLAQCLSVSAGLILLDNAEHVLGAVRKLVSALQHGAPRWRIVVTSQVPLGLAGEQLFPLAPLAVPADDDERTQDLEEVPAVRLFVQRVAERLPGFTLAPRHGPSVLAVCRALEGLPLSLELAAARVPMLGVHGLAERLAGDNHDSSSQLDWVRAPSRVAPERQRSLEQTVAWSVGMLDELQRASLAAMAVFRGGVNLSVAMAVARDCGVRTGAEAADLVQALVDRSLLLPAVQAATEPRLRMLEGVREFLLRELDDRGEYENAMHVLATAQATHWRQADADAGGTPALDWSDVHRPELANLRVCLGWLERQDDKQALVTLLGFTGHLWHRMGIQREGRDWFLRAQPHVATSPPVLQARFHAAWAMQSAAAHLLDPGAVLDLLPWIVTSLQSAGDLRGAAMAAHAAFHLAVRTNRPALRQQALVWQEANTTVTEGELARRALRMNRAYELRMQGDAAAYERAMRSELEIAHRHGALVEGWIVTQALGLALMDQDRADEASELLELTLGEMRQRQMLAHYPALAGVWLIGLGTLGRTDQLRRSLLDYVQAFVGGDVRFMLHLPAALLAWLEGRAEDAARLLGRYAESQPLKPISQGRAGPQQLTERAHAQLHEQLAAQFGPAQLERLQCEGRSMSEDAAIGLGIGGINRSATSKD